MKIEKIESNTWRVRKQINGKRYAIYFDHKPSQKEIIEQFNNKMIKAPSRTTGTFRECASDYINMKKNVLSPRTVREYTLYINRLPSWFTGLRVPDIEQPEIQKCINELAKTLSPKTVRTLHGFISSILGAYKPQLVIRTTLPQKEASEPYIPTDEEVRIIVQQCRDNAPHFYPAIMLACWGLRRSEILAVTDKDVEGNLLHIRKAIVQDVDGNWVTKTTKTTLSTRDIYIPDDVAAYIKKNGYAYKGGPQSISNWLSRTETALGMPHFSLHKLRHYFASKLSAEGIPDADIMAMGGWKTDAVMKTVYRHSLNAKTDEGKKQISKLLAANLQ